MPSINVPQLIKDINNNPAVKAASDVMYDTIQRIGKENVKKVAQATVEVTFQSVKTGLDGFVPPFIRPLAYMGLDAGMAATEQALNATIDRIAASEDPNPKTK